MYLYFTVNFVCYFEFCDFWPSSYRLINLNLKFESELRHLWIFEDHVVATTTKRASIRTLK